MAIESKFHMARVKPVFDQANHAAAIPGGDVLFDWHAFEVPRGGACVRSVSAIINGKDSAVSNNSDKNFSLVFGKSVNGIAPPSLGVSNTQTTKAMWAAARRHIIGYKYISATEMRSADTEFRAYSLLSNSFNRSAMADDESEHGLGNPEPIILEGDPNYSGTTKGYQTIWVAGIAIEGSFDFGTGVELNEADASDLAALGTATLVVDGTDVRDLFCIGDEIVAADNAAIGTIKSMTHDGSDGTIVLESAHTDALADDDEICFKTPIELMLGLEY